MRTIKILFIALLLSGFLPGYFNPEITSDVRITPKEAREIIFFCFENHISPIRIVEREPDGTLVIVGDDGNEYGVNVNCCEK